MRLFDEFIIVWPIAIALIAEIFAIAIFPHHLYGGGLFGTFVPPEASRNCSVHKYLSAGEAYPPRVLPSRA